MDWKCGRETMYDGYQCDFIASAIEHIDASSNWWQGTIATMLQDCYPDENAIESCDPEVIYPKPSGIPKVILSFYSFFETKVI